MAFYKLDELLASLSGMKKDGFEYINISVIEPDEDDGLVETLNIDAVISKNDSETDIIDSVNLPENYYLDLLS